MCYIYNLQIAIRERVLIAICSSGRFIKEITEDMWGNWNLGHESMTGDTNTGSIMRIDIDCDWQWLKWLK